jgi:hypothetical protein
MQLINHAAKRPTELPTQQHWRNHNKALNVGHWGKNGLRPLHT